MRKDLLTSVFERMRPRLFEKARKMLSDEEDARDVLQDAFFKLWQVHPAFQRESHAEGVLVTTVRNLSIDRIRRNATHPATPIDENSNPLAYIDADGMQETESRRETFRKVEVLISRHLSPRDREILLRRDRDEWDFDEIATHFDITEANARLIVARARKTIRTIYLQQNS